MLSDHYYKKKYGISLKEYKDMLRAQNNQCAICGEPPWNKSLSVDHCHVTDQVRGLLCQSCNAGLGLFKDSTKNLLYAMAYLREFCHDHQH